jgi:hypothetical protein
MSMNKTRQQVIEALSDSDSRVLALTGRWGTGKSYLWKQVQASTSDEAIGAALYVSLFGVRTVPEAKLKLVQAALRQRNSKGKWKEKLAEGTEQLLRVARHFHKGADAFGELAQLSAPSLLEGSVIVIDDMERKHKDLHVDEVLGFIDEYSTRYQCRFVLIFNVDRLGQDIHVWNEMREKVVDHELQLQTTPEEAFEIARTNVRSQFADSVGKAAIACGITNIRILHKIIKATDRILNTPAAVSDAVVRRTVPSIVLLAAIHYKGIEDPPSFEFIQDFGGLPSASEVRKPADGEDPTQAKRARWTRLLRSIEFSGPDQFEPLVRKFLESGLSGDSEIERVLRRYVADEERARAISKAEELKFRIIWDASSRDEDLLALARSAATDVHHLAPGQVSALYGHVSSLQGGNDVAELLIDTWVERFAPSDTERTELESFYAPVKGYHPKVVAACVEKRRARAPGLTIFGSLERISRTGDWGGEQEYLNACSVDAFRSALIELPPASLRLVVAKMLEMGLNRSAYSGFSTAIGTFLNACDGIASDPSSGRLGKILGDRVSLYRARGGQ